MDRRGVGVAVERVENIFRPATKHGIVVHKLKPKQSYKPEELGFTDQADVSRNELLRRQEHAQERHAYGA